LANYLKSGDRTPPLFSTKHSNFNKEEKRSQYEKGQLYLENSFLKRSIASSIALPKFLVGLVAVAVAGGAGKIMRP